jgi:hypothetical protein
MRRRRIAGLTIPTVVFLLVSTTALANNWDKRTGLDAWIRYELCDLNVGQHDAWHDNNTHDIVPTELSVDHFHECTTVEVRVNDTSYGSNQGPGWWECHDGSSTVCYSGHIHINTDKVNGYSSALKLALMCQEVGHSVGLAHADSGLSCMNNPLSTDRQHLVRHDTDLIDANY